jgi:hypothetical protein
MTAMYYHSYNKLIYSQNEPTANIYLILLIKNCCFVIEPN